MAKVIRTNLIKLYFIIIMKREMDAGFTRINRGRVSDEIIKQIKGVLFNGGMTIGDQLPTERDLAKRLGVSRVPVREALFSLQQFGLLDIKRGTGGGIFVSEPNMDPFGEFFALMLHLGKATVHDLTEARLFMEPNVAKAAAERASVDDLKKIESTIRQYEDAVNRNAERSFVDMSFHISLAEASKNIAMPLIIRGLMLLLHKTVRDLNLTMNDRRRGIIGHKEIFEAVKARDPERAFQSMANHVRNMATLWRQ
jgi:GntR family transcriptional regulator, transcriptional repressor for pyruvate dehydrogenase complex